MPTPIAAVMIHVSDVDQALAWYQRAFPMSVRETIKSHSFQFLNCGGIRIEVVRADQNGQSMCQVLDPWGNCIGLRGPLNE